MFNLAFDILTAETKLGQTLQTNNLNNLNNFNILDTTISAPPEKSLMEQPSLLQARASSINETGFIGTENIDYQTATASGISPPPAPLAANLSLPPTTGNGLLAQYYEGLDLTNLRAVRIDPSINFNWNDGSPAPSLPPDLFSVRWTGQVQPQHSETYTFYTYSDDGVRLWVNGQLLIDNWTNHAPTEDFGTITLNAGQRYDIRMEYYEFNGGATSQLLWSSPSQSKEIIPENYLFTNTQGLNASAIVTQQAQSAYSFVDSIGINTHLRYYDTSYGNYPLIKQRLLELGIRHIRDGGSDPTWIQRTNELGALGIRSTIVIDPIIGTGPNASYDLKPPHHDVYTLVKNLVPAGVEAIEILNEFDVFRRYGYSRNGIPVTSDNWVEYLRDFTRDTYIALNSDPVTQQIPIIGPSFVYPDSSSRVGDLSQWIDYGNAHPYSNPLHPGNGNLQRDLENRSRPSASLPMMVTEIGYSTGNANSDRPVSETVQGKYIPRMFLENFNSGVYRTFSYEFIDQRLDPNNSEMNYGILRHDGSPKPAYTALQNLIGLLNDSSTPFTPGTLTYSLSGETQNVRQTLLQKSNGNFYMVLWLEVPSTDQTISQTINLSLNTPIQLATTYLSNYSVTPTGQYQSPTQLTLTVPDSPLVIRLSPSTN